MATQTVGKTATSEKTVLGPSDIARAVIAPLASLKLTVFLLVMGVVVTFIATLEQTRFDVFQVKMRHFGSIMVEVPFQTFFVPRWFPEMQNVPGSFYIPSGMTILVLMILNLSAAHILRFRLQAKGKKLGIGLIATAFAAFLTWAVIFNGQSSNGLQGQPPLSWKQMWMLLQVGLLCLSIGAVYGWLALDKDRRIERVVLGIAAGICIASLALTLLLREQAFIGDSAMRILWQLTQATMAALVSYVACVILFRRKAGIVLLHLGVAGLMLNEIYVTTTNEEQRMTIFEGQTVSNAIDIRATELAIIDSSDPEFDNIIAIPGNKLRPGETVSDSKLPFDVECISYLPNSDLRRITGSAETSPADTGIGQRLEAMLVSGVTGTDSEQTVDIASAYVKIRDKSDGSSLGSHLVTQHIEEHNSDEITVGDKSYRIALRFKTDYKPYSLTLIDAQREDYIGTDTPQFYGSNVELNDFVNDIKSEQLIWMNNPLRYADETFYQSGMNTLQDGRQLSIIQIVLNKGWMIPYVCCMFTVVGLIAQFGNSLLGYMEKNRQQLQKTDGVKAVLPPDSPQAKTENTISESEPSSSKWIDWLPTMILMAIVGVWAMGETRKDRSSQVVSKMRLDLLGQIPVTINGRVQPLDSFARNTARQLSKREFVYDGNDKKQSAIRWFADNAFEADGFENYRTFRIEDKNILNALDLPTSFKKPRANFRFTLAEIMEAEPTLRKLIPDSSESDSDNWTVFQKRLNIVARQLQRLYGLKLTFGGPERPEQELLAKLDDASRMISSPLIPLVVPSDDTEKPWISYTELKNRTWLGDLAKQFEKTSTASLSQALIETEVLPPMRQDTIRSQIIQRFLAAPEFRKLMEEQLGETDPAVLARLMEENWEQLPEESRKQLMASEAPLVDAMIARQTPRFVAMMEKQLATINGAVGDINPVNNEFAELLAQLRPAYLDGDSDKFNATLVSYLEQIKATPPAGMSIRKLATEKMYNSTSPFYIASVFYLAAFFASVFAWIGWRKPFNRAATVMLSTGLAIQVFGIISRIVISGRPPVTNLYSSVLFVSAALVVLMLVVEAITKLGIGNITASVGAFLAMTWAWTMTIVDGDTFTVMVAVLDTQFWLSTHVVCISIGYTATLVAGFLGLGYLIGMLLTPAFASKVARRNFANVIYGVVCFGLLCSFFGTVLGGLWGDDSWGRFWGWDPKENGALMIVLWNAVILHARWGGMVRDRGLAALTVLGNVIVLWSWKGVNAMGVGLHAYAGTEDSTVIVILAVACVHLLIASLVIIPSQYWFSFAREESS